MKKLVVSLFFILFFAPGIWAQDVKNPFSKEISLQADEMGWYLRCKDYDAVLGYMIPGVVRIMGGKTMMKATLRKEYINLEEKGYRLVAVNFEEPGALIDSAGVLQCLVPEKQTLTGRHGDLVVPAAVLAISKDNGRIWRFVELSPGITQHIKDMEPAISPRLLQAQ